MSKSFGFGVTIEGEGPASKGIKIYSSNNLLQGIRKIDITIEPEKFICVNLGFLMEKIEISGIGHLIGENPVTGKIGEIKCIEWVDGDKWEAEENLSHIEGNQRV